MRTLLADLAYTFRLLRKSPGFAAIASTTIALGIGATTAVFSVVDGVLLKRLPVENQDRLLVVWTTKPNRGFHHWPFSYRSYEGMRDRLRTASGVAAHPYSGTLPAVVRLDDGSAMPLRCTAVTGQWFGVLGVRPRAGRLITPDDDRAGAPHVVVLSSLVAARLFGRVEAAVGGRLRIQETTFTVVGVTPAAFEYPRTAEAWVPAVGFKDSPYVAWDLVVRVAPEFTTQQTIADLGAALSTLAETGPLGQIEKNQTIHAQPLAQEIVGSVRPALLMLAGAVGLMLIVAGVNVANLLIAHGLARRGELAVRAAIGASRLRLFRQLATEAIVLAAIGAVAGVFIAFVALNGLLALAPPQLPRVAEVAVDGRALLFAGGVAVVVAIVFGTLPVLYSARIEPLDTLRSPGGGAGLHAPRYRVRHVLVVTQIAATMVVLSTAGLLAKSFDRMQQLDVGFAAGDLFLAELALPLSRYPEPVDMQRAMTRLAAYVATQSGVTHATAVSMAPFAGTEGVDASVFAEGQTSAEGSNPIVNYEGIDGAYFRTIGVPIVRGRAIDERDREGSQPVVVINETFARIFWPGRDPIGRRIKWGTSTSDAPWLTVVGLVADTRYRDLTTVRPSMYVPYPHGIPVSPAYVVVRSTNPAAATTAIRRTIADLEPAASIVSLAPMPQLLAGPLARPRFQAALVACFAALALALSLVGTYGMLSFLVRLRRREIGVRMALGASPANVCSLVLRHGAVAGGLGILIGVALAVAATKLIQPVLFGVDASDPFVLLLTAALLLAAVFAASLLPTRTAIRTDPATVLRSAG